MKNLSWGDKLIFLLNSLVAAILLLSNALPYLSPKSFGGLSVFSLAVPGLIILNILFAIYWVIKLKKQFLLSTLVLLIGFNQLNLFYKFNNKELMLTDNLKVMSYNVRQFNLNGAIKKPTIDQDIYDFVNKKSPDIVSFQEFKNSKKIDLDFTYKFIAPYIKGKARNAIYSKYKIINSGVINFKNSGNGAIYVDILKKSDTIRIYNIHLQSLRIQLNKENFGEKDTERLLKRLKTTFKRQVAQVDQIVAHQKTSKHKTVVMGDFNNTAFSWAYHQIKADKNDAFVEAGKGFGKSYDYMLPARIDFILADQQFKINNFKTYDVKYSDHFPIMARLEINRFN
jgi:endonuclease/exonuclease/phosphatase family metal-dependent hydrolase